MKQRSSIKTNDFLHFFREQLWTVRDRVWRSAELTPLFIDRYTGPRQNPRMDAHDYYELFYVFKGQGQIRSQKQLIPLRPCWACLIPPETGHVEQSEEVMDTLWVGLKGSMVERFGRETILTCSGRELADHAEHLWLQSIKPYGLIGPELDGLAQAMLGSFLRLSLTTNRLAHEATLEDILIYFNEHYWEDMNMSAVAGKFGFSESYFYRIFKRCSGQTPIAYLTNVRIQNAVNLLKNTSLSIKRISQMVGYHDALYFSKVFRRITGRSPKHFL